jgi:outer membrane protein
MLRKLQVHLPAISLAACALFSVSAAAQGGSTSGGASEGVKIGIVLLEEAILSTNEGKKEMDVLQQRFAPKTGPLKAQNEELDKLKTQLQAQAGRLTEEERGKRVKDIAEKQKTLQRASEDLQNDFQQAEQETVSRVWGKLQPILEAYADKNGYTIILDVSKQQTSVLWARPGLNITKVLVDAYNAGSSASATTPKKP